MNNRLFLSPRRMAQRILWWGCLVGGSLLAGCSGSGSPPPGAPQGTMPVSGASIPVDDLFQMAIDNLEHLERYHSGQMLQQVIERLNQWLKYQHLPEGWKPDPLIRRLPQSYQELPAMQELDKLTFSPEDGYLLLAAMWSRDLAKWVTGQTTDELQQAQKLFDWTVRNIQLQPATGAGAPAWRQLPWETLLLGRGNSLDRAWVFILLARQLGIEAFLIALTPEESTGSAGEVPWAVGVLRGQEIYVFDPAWGIPIPGPDGIRKGADGGLEIRPATLRQLADNPLLLRRLDLGETQRYPVVSADLARAVGLIPAQPAELSVRMQMVESRLVGSARMRLAVRASEQAERLKTAGGLRDVKLWTRPFTAELERANQPEFLRQQALALAPFEVGNMAPLWRGRVAHLRGHLRGQEGATSFYHQARPPESELNIAVAEGKMPMPVKNIFLLAKMHASYWLGLLCFDLAQYPAAIDYLKKRTLEPWPQSSWLPGIHYNLARTYEALGQYEEAIRYYEMDPSAPDHYGRLRRARWLRELFLPAETSPPPPPSSPKPSSEKTDVSPPSPEKSEKTSPSPPKPETLPPQPASSKPESPSLPKPSDPPTSPTPKPASSPEPASPKKIG